MLNRLVAFIRIPKTGSSSILQGLENHGIPNIASKTTTKDRVWVINNSQLESLNSRMLSDHYTFAVIRDPLERFISGWKFCLRMNWISDNVSPMDILQAIDKKEMGRYQRGVYFHVAVPQCRWLFNGDDLLCDNIIKFENLEKDVSYLTKQLGVPNFKMPHLKNSRNQHQKHPGTNEYYILKYPKLREFHKSVFEEDWKRLPYG